MRMGRNTLEKSNFPLKSLLRLALLFGREAMGLYFFYGNISIILLHIPCFIDDPTAASAEFIQDAIAIAQDSIWLKPPHIVHDIPLSMLPAVQEV
jgi:hypothetical protein